ncbi:MAG: acyl-CoA dehydrogenase family protein [Sphingomonas sp.]|uniref:acyl-CoA dehydrogenase family protein n=1 Tax=Sphingomonas sp. TaxID=28214 RepID=UPI0035A87322|nr:acyl-CoA dehydrogenase family protein [Sphingomonas sp.]
MDFNDTPDEAAFRAEVRDWLAANAALRSDTKDTTAVGLGGHLANARAFQRKKVAAGFSVITMPRAYGGRGGTPIQQLIYLQEEARYDNCGVPEIFGVGLGMCLPTILHNGTDAQRDRYLGPGISGDEIWCQLFSEPSGGSDVAGARTSAVRDGDDWIVNGQKIWTSGAHYCDFGIITTRTDPTARKHRGMTMFIVDMKSPGIEVRPIRQLTNTSEFNEVFFTDVRVPDANRLGALNDGWNVALSTLMHERVSIGARSETLDWRRLLDIARAQEIDGRPAIDDARVGDQIVDSWLIEFGAQLTSFRGQTALSRGEQPGPEQSVLKMLKAPLLQQNAYRAMEMAGEAGVLTHIEPGDNWDDVINSLLFSPGIRIAGGSDEILRNIVAERVLGLPQDVRLDKDVPFNEIPV